MQYLIVSTPRVSGAARLESIDNVPNFHHLAFGVPFGQTFPAEASFKMNAEFPKNIRLTDALRNISSLWVVSARLKEKLESLPGALFQNEVLPVKIINHKARVEKAPYFIIHQLDHPACVDEAKSDGIRSKLNPEQFQFMTRMVLEETRIDPKLMILRAKQFPDVLLMRRELAEKLKAENFSCVEFSEIEGYAF